VPKNVLLSFLETFENTLRVRDIVRESETGSYKERWNLHSILPTSSIEKSISSVSLSIYLISIYPCLLAKSSRYSVSASEPKISSSAQFINCHCKFICLLKYKQSLVISHNR